MAKMQILVSVLLTLQVVTTVYGRFAGRPKDIPHYKYLLEKWHGHFNRDPSKFPTSRGAIARYKSPFSTESTAAELYANVNMSTPESLNQIKFLDKITPPRVDEIIPGKVYQAKYYALGFPVIYVLPDDTLVWVDAPESAKAAYECIAAFRAIPAIGNKPVVALIYTIFHPDHTWGAGPIVNDPNNNGQEPVIIAHSRLMVEGNLYETFKSFKTPRLYRMFGPFVPDPPHIHDGGVVRLRLEGPYKVTNPPTEELKFPDTDTVLSKTMGGVEFQFISVPGYTSDQFIVWVPEWDVMHGSDVFYDAIPNLYTLRGEPARDVILWAAGTRKAASYMPQYLVTTHGYSHVGKENINTILTNYADAIQYLHDQTVRYMAKGYPPDIIPNVVRLPASLASKDYLKPSYGIQETAIKGIYDYYVGWFSGLAEDLFTVDRFERGSKLIKLIGCSEMQQEAAMAYNAGEYEWALEMATYLWRDDEDDLFALNVRTESMKRLAEIQNSVAGRNYYLSTVMEDWDLVHNSVSTKTGFILLHLDGAMRNLQFHLNSTAAEDVTKVLYVSLPDKNIVYKMTIRNSIMFYEEVSTPGTDGATMTIKDECDLTNPSDVFCWRFMLAGYVPFHAAPITGGTATDVIHFFSYFDFTDEEETGYSPDGNTG